MFPSLRSMRLGVALTLLAFVFGFGLGGAFGAAESSFKGSLQASADAVLATTYGGDAAKAAPVVKKAWTYLKRAHMHAGGMAAAALAMILLLAALPGPARTPRKAVAFALGFGALVYPLFWLLAGFRAPGLGGTGAAKETLKWLAWPGAGAFLVGTIGTLALFLKAAFFAPPAAD